jgi:eukaryotic-like serine/threonine-protein kinase
VTSGPNPEELGPGSKLDRYEIVRAVAQGGMGAVWLGRFGGKHGFEKLVALKTILPELAADRRFHDMFLDEARISQRIVHVNVAQILDLGEHAGTTFIVFEWVEGSSLEAICRAAMARSEPLPLTVLLRIVADACAGLHAAHELTDDAGEPLEVVHRDVTPDNVLVSDGGIAKIIDFGVAKARYRLAGDTRSGLVKGTPQYMAPEQASGNEVDRRADIWALGAVLYRALSGGPPFAARDDLAAFILNKEPLRELPESIPDDVRAIVGKAMQRHASDRYATADEMRTALEAAIRNHGASFSPAEISALLKKLSPPKRKSLSSEQVTVPEGSDIEERASASPYALTELAAASATAEPVVSMPTEPAARSLPPPKDRQRLLRGVIFVAVFVVVAAAVALLVPLLAD